MQQTLKYSFFFFIAFTHVNAQLVTSKNLNGKIIANADDLSGINIKNLKSNTAISTQLDGSFSIGADVGDTLMISSIQFKWLKIKLKKEDFCEAKFLIKLENQTYFLDEVQIKDYKNINAVSLGIIPKGQKKYTPAERKLNTATGGGNQYGIMNSVSFDGIINAISGRTTMLTKEVKIEHKEKTINKLNLLYEDTFYIEKLKIPKEYVNGFKYYIVENDELVQSINSKNYTLVTFLMNQLALKYRATIQ